MTIAENIIKIRKQFDLTQEELGEIAGVSDKAVSTWERGTAEPRMGAIQKIADHLNIKKSDIIEDDTEGYYLDRETAKLAQEIYEDPTTRILLDAKRDLTPDDLQLVVDMVKALKAKEGK